MFSRRRFCRYRCRCRWENLAMVILISLAFSGLRGGVWQQEECSSSMPSSLDSSSTSVNTNCEGNTKFLFAEAISVAVLGTSSNNNDKGDDDEEEDQQQDGTLKDDNDSEDKAIPENAGRRLMSSSLPEKKTPLSIGQIFRKAGRKALGGGLPGAVAGVVQVLTLMWLRTIINYQSRYGASFLRAVSILYNEGGIGRFYRGVGFALFQAPMSKFVATASNDGVLAFLSSFPLSKHWNPAVTTIFASLFVGGFRMILMPIDTCKTVLQVDSREGFRALMRRVRAGKISALYQGALATAASSTIGHYPWFVTFNALSSAEWLKLTIKSKLLRNASIGLISSVISDTIVNVFRVIKTTKQSIGSKHDFTYSDTIRMIVAADGWKGLFGRGLRTRVLANSIQSTLFTVIWRGLAERWGNDEDDDDENENENDTANDNSIESDTETTHKVKKHNLRKPSKTMDEDFVEEK
jgi:hypothetical protein